MATQIVQTLKEVFSMNVEMDLVETESTAII